MFGIIVSGQPRSGKSTLVKSLYSCNEILPCNVDAKIFRKIKSKKIDKKISLRNKIENVIGNEVYQDSGKKIKTSILKELNIPVPKIESILKKNYSECRPEFILLDILNKASNIKKKKGWILPDLGAEDYFPYINKRFPKIKLILLYRNPLESIVASLYWRTFPEIRGNLIELIIRWNHSFSRAIQLIKEYPKNVEIFFYDELSTEKRKKISKFFNIKNFRFGYNPTTTYFSYKNNLWFCPNKEYNKLLEDNQMALILKSCLYEFKIIPVKDLNFTNCFSLFYIRILNKIFFMIASKFPLGIKTIMNFYFSPIKSILNNLKKLLKLILNLISR